MINFNDLDSKLKMKLAEYIFNGLSADLDFLKQENHISSINDNFSKKDYSKLVQFYLDNFILSGSYLIDKLNKIDNI